MSAAIAGLIGVAAGAIVQAASKLLRRGSTGV
jgi:hypothetical protein